MATKPNLTEKIAPALGALPAGVHILTCDGEALVVSWVQQAGFEPPCISIALAKDRPVTNAILTGHAFILSLLPEGGLKLCKPFFSGDKKAIAAALEKNGIVKGALSALKCKYLSLAGSPDHNIIIAEVTDGMFLLPEGSKPEIHLRKNGFKY